MKNYFFLLLTLFFICIANGQSKNKKIKVLIVDGFNNHNWQQTTKVVTHILNKSSLFETSVATAPTNTNSKAYKNWNPKFKQFDVVIQNTNNIKNKEIKWPEKVEKQLEKYVASGGGLYILHAANNAFTHWKEYDDMIGLGWRNKENGIALQINEDETITQVPVGIGKKTYHGPRKDLVIHTLNNHEIHKGFPKKWKTPNMELYKFARGSAKNLTVISYAKDEDTGINWPVEWVVRFGKGNVYNSSMGHLWKGDIYPIHYKCIGFQTLLIRTTEWLATGKVAYKLPKIFPNESTIRVVNEKLTN